MARVRWGFVLRGGLAGLLAIYAIFCLSLYLLQEALIFEPLPLAAETPYAYRLPHEEIMIPAGDGAVHAVAFEAPEPKGVILYLHGAGGNLRTWGRLGPAMVRRGYDVLMIDYRGFGKSRGELRDEAGLHADAEAAYAYLLQRYPEEQIILYGRSLGSSLAARLASRHRPRLVVLESPFYSLEGIARRRVALAPMALLKYPLPTHSWIGAVRSPIHLIHGTADRLVPYVDSLRLLEHARAPATLYTIAGGGHADMHEFDGYYDALRAILGPVRY